MIHNQACRGELWAQRIVRSDPHATGTLAEHSQVGKFVRDSDTNYQGHAFGDGDGRPPIAMEARDLGYLLGSPFRFIWVYGMLRLLSFQLSAVIRKNAGLLRFLRAILTSLITVR